MSDLRARSPPQSFARRSAAVRDDAAGGAAKNAGQVSNFASTRRSRSSPINPSVPYASAFVGGVLVVGAEHHYAWSPPAELGVEERGRAG